jgi:hypothetical protein
MLTPEKIAQAYLPNSIVDQPLWKHHDIKRFRMGLTALIRQYGEEAQNAVKKELIQFLTGDAK